MNLVISGHALLHDLQQVVICVPAVDHQRFLHGHGQSQLTLKHLSREEPLCTLEKLTYTIYHKFGVTTVFAAENVT